MSDIFEADRWDEIAGQFDLDAEEQTDLVDASRADPAPGLPRMIDGNLVEPGAWFHLADPRTQLPPDCPVQPLGMDEEAFYFLNWRGMVVTLTASASGKGPLSALFAGRSRYLEWGWPRFGAMDKESCRPKVNGYDADALRHALFDACSYKGVFDDMDRVRGRGAWVGNDGRLIYHAGDKVMFPGGEREPGELGRWVFPARPPIQRPWEEACPAGAMSAGTAMLQYFELWNWERKWLDPKLLLGWVAAAAIGGALGWRPMVIVTGDQATGKSTLQQLVDWLLGGALVKSANTTAAGIYQKVKHDSVPILLDELEAEADTRKTDEIIKLARIASSGGLMLRGGADHKGKEFQARSAMFFSMINVPPLNAQDQSRTAVLALNEFAKDAPDPEFDAGAIQELGRQILRRMMDGWSRWPRVLKAFRGALKEAGHNGRGADQFGTLAAAYHLACFDHDPTEAELAEWARHLKRDELAETANHVPNWRQCLDHLVNVQPDVLKTRARKSLGAVVEAFRKNGMQSFDDLEEVCGLVGLAVSFPANEMHGWETARLFVPSTHPEVTKLFNGTVWAGRFNAPGPWGNALRQCPDREAIYFGTCGKGLSKKCGGYFVRLAKVFE